MNGGGGGGMGQMGMGMGNMLGSVVGAYFLNKRSKGLGKRLDLQWLMNYYPALQYYKWLMEVAKNPEQHPEVVGNVMESMKPGLENWAVAKGIFNPANVQARATRQLTPFLFGLGQQGAAGMVGGWRPLPSSMMEYEKLARQAGMLESSFGAGQGMMAGGMGGGGMGGGQQTAQSPYRGTWNPWESG
jgi:hypothetical protein